MNSKIREAAQIILSETESKWFIELDTAEKLSNLKDALIERGFEDDAIEANEEWLIAEIESYSAEYRKVRYAATLDDENIIIGDETNNEDHRFVKFDDRGDAVLSNVESGYQWTMDREQFLKIVDSYIRTEDYQPIFDASTEE